MFKVVTKKVHKLMKPIYFDTAENCTCITRLMTFTEIVITPILFYLPWQLKTVATGRDFTYGMARPLLIAT